MMNRMKKKIETPNHANPHVAVDVRGLARYHNLAQLLRCQAVTEIESVEGTNQGWTLSNAE